MKSQKQFDISVLSVEDEELTREEIHPLLQERCREVFIAQNAAEGLEQFLKNGPDLVVTDILMPVMDGLQMAQEIRTFNRDVSIIMTTAYSETSYMIDAIDANVDQFVIKPIKLKMFFATMEKCAENCSRRLLR